MRHSVVIDAVTQAFVYGDSYTRDYVIPTLTPEEQDRCYAIGHHLEEGGADAFAQDIVSLYDERDMQLFCDMLKGERS